MDYGVKQRVNINIEIVMWLQYGAFILLLFNLGGYIQRLYTVLFMPMGLLYLLFYRINIASKYFFVYVSCAVYMIINAVGSAVFGNSLHVAITNTFPTMFMIVTIFIVCTSRNCINIDSILNKLSAMCFVASIANIILTIISILSGEIQEGYRYLATQIVCIGPLLLYYYFFIKRRFFFFVTGVVSVIAIICTYSKQMYLSLFLILFFSPFISNKKISVKLRNIVIFCSLLVGSLLVLLWVGKSSTGFLGVLSGAISYNLNILLNKDLLLNQETYRLTEIKYALESFKQSWLLGIGSGASYTSFGLQSWVHNAWVWMLLNFGIFGTLLFILPFISLTMITLKILKRNRNDKESGFHFFFFLMGVMIILFNSLFSPVFFRDASTMVFLGFYVGLLINMIRVQTVEKGEI